MEDYLNSLKWEINIGKKPRGKWRPCIGLIFYNNNNQNVLNIETQYNNVQRYRLFELRTSIYCVSSHAGGKELAKLPMSPLRFYTVADEKNIAMPYVCCQSTPAIGCWSIRYFDRNYIQLYPEWRPGIPDYTDYYEFIRDNWAIPAVTEYQRRIQEALDSVETEETKYTSDTYMTQERKKGGMPVRKLKLSNAVAI